MSGVAQTASKTPVKTSLPIELLSTETARVFRHVHPAVLLSAYYLRFPSLVADPVSALLQSLIPLAVVQIAYAVVCLPAAGSVAKVPKRVKLNAPRRSGETPSAQAFTVFFALILSLLSVPLLTIIQILFGAPITTHIAHTLLSSSHIALLAVLPIVYVHGADSGKWREVVSAYSPVDEVFGGAVGCFLGAWLGAVPIPLDWDREWQKWPVTIVTGAYAGYVVGKMLGGWALKGKKIEFDSGVV